MSEYCWRINPITMNNNAINDELWIVSPRITEIKNSEKKGDKYIKFATLAVFVVFFKAINHKTKGILISKAPI